MTPDAAFGHDRRGTVETVAELGRQEGFDLVVAAPFEVAGRSVRSSDIRTAIAAGDLALAAELLGRPYSIVGTAGENGLLACAMPVALPPSGSYRTVVECRGVSEARSATLDIGVGATLRVQPPGSETDGARVRVAFADG
jgi:FAD synthase